MGRRARRPSRSTRTSELDTIFDGQSVYPRDVGYGMMRRGWPDFFRPCVAEGDPRARTPRLRRNIRMDHTELRPRMYSATLMLGELVSGLELVPSIASFSSVYLYLRGCTAFRRRGVPCRS